MFGTETLMPRVEEQTMSFATNVIPKDGEVLVVHRAQAGLRARDTRPSTGKDRSARRRVLGTSRGKSNNHN